MQNGKKRALIIGAGPAGLTAALELLRRTGIVPLVLEKSRDIGGLSRTVNHNGYRMDIGGHRFFSKSDRVMNWWLDILPVETTAEAQQFITYHNQTRALNTTRARAAPSGADRVMLIRNRKSRIYFLRKFFEYPVTLSAQTLKNLGAIRTFKIVISYLRSAARKITPEETLEDFFINRFGRELYRTFFKSYTEKVWGVPCSEISAEWGAQRVKGLSVTTALLHIVRKMFASGKDIQQKKTETSLIEKFLYPKYGPGQLWECVAAEIVERGGEIETGWTVSRIFCQTGKVRAVEAVHEDGERRIFDADYVFSTMPVKELIAAMEPAAPPHVREVSDGLIYRDFITVGMLLSRLHLGGAGGNSQADAPGRAEKLLKDNWIYIQEPDVLMGRMQIFNNWSPYLVADPDKVWLGLEYFCNETDQLWRMSDKEMIALAAGELEQIGLASRKDVLDAVVIRVPKTYPAYFGSYHRFDEVRRYVDAFENLYLVGRNGMHKYNNQDHSMLTAMTAVDNIVSGRTDKSNIWAVNTEQEYHETKSAAAPQPEAEEQVATAAD
jgi:protoporphyrinogen oxidase